MAPVKERRVSNVEGQRRAGRYPARNVVVAYDAEGAAKKLGLTRWTQSRRDPLLHVMFIMAVSMDDRVWKRLLVSDRKVLIPLLLSPVTVRLAPGLLLVKLGISGVMYTH